MSVQAMSWALALPKASLENPAARHVLLCLANYAGSDGRGAFPSALTLSDDTGLSERTVRLKLDELEQAGFITEGNQAIAAAYIERRDRRPVVYDLQLKRGANAAPRKERGADNRTGCSSQQNGVQENAERGAAAAPNTPLNHQGTEEQLQRDLAAEIAEQDLAAAECPSPNQRFAMFASWEPNPKALADQIAIAGNRLESSLAMKLFERNYVITVRRMIEGLPLQAMPLALPARAEARRTPDIGNKALAELRARRAGASA